MNRFSLTFFVALALTACSNDGDSHSTVTPPQPTLDRPIADAGHNMTLQQGATVVLNASGSHDPEGRPISYLWSLVAKPSASQSTLSDTTSPFPSFYLDAVGDYTFELVVNNGESDSLPVTVTISDSDGIPIADAGPDRRYRGTGSITLDGSKSFDSDGDQLDYQWSIISAPAGSNAALARADSASPVFTPDMSGDYEFELVVSDGVNRSNPDSVIISDQNVKPVANAGQDQMFTTGTLVALNGSASFDADGDALSYQWHIASAPNGSSASISSADTVSATFTPDVSGDFILALVVSDGILNSDVSTVTLRQSEHRPVADAGNDIAAQVGQTVQLDGTNSSDLDGDTLTANWVLASKPKTSGATLQDTHTMHPSLTIDADGDYVVALTVFDGSQTSQVDSVRISSRNLAPTANAGASMTLQAGQIAHLNGSASSDPEGMPLSYQWSILSAPSNSSAQLSDDSVVAPDFTPDVAGSYVFQLIVSDGSLTSAPSTVILSEIDLPPNANAGSDQSVASGVLVSLDGSRSSDPEGLALNYAWSFTSKPTGSQAVLTSSSAAIASFTTDVAGDYIAQLIVTDASGQSDVDSIVVRDTASNTMPVANAGADLQVDLGTNIVLDGSASVDADGDALTYSWAMMSRPNGSTAQLNDSNTASPNFTPDVEGDFVFQLVVSDGTATSLPDVVMVHDTDRNLAPTAVISVGGTLSTGQTITLDGSSSSDANGDALTYQWSLFAPSGSSAALSSPNVASPTFVTDLKGDYVIKLVVSDGRLASAAVAQTVSVKDAPPGVVGPLPTGDNLIYLSTEGGAKRTGAIFSVSESDLTQVTELVRFEGLPGVAIGFPEHGPVVSPSNRKVYTLLSESGVYGVASIVELDIDTGEADVFTSFPPLVVSGNVVADFRKKLLFHPDGKSAYAYSYRGGVNDVGVLVHIDFDPTSPTYREVSVIAEVGRQTSNYGGSQFPFATELRWSGTNKLMALFGRNAFNLLSLPAVEFTASDPNDLSASWNVAEVGGGAAIYSLGRKFFYDTDTILSISGYVPPILSSIDRTGFGGGDELRECGSGFGLFALGQVDVYALCRSSTNGMFPVMYLTNRAGAYPTVVRSFSNLTGFDVVGAEPASLSSKIYLTLNDRNAASFAETNRNPATFGITLQPSRLVEVSLPNYSTRTLLSSNSSDLGSYFIGDVAVINDPMGQINDQFITQLSYNGGDSAAGALITYDRLTGTSDVLSLGFERGGYPFGRVVQVANDRFIFSVASIGAQVKSGGTVVYDSANGTITPIQGLPRFFRPGLGLQELSNGSFVGLGLSQRLTGNTYELYSIDASTGSFNVIARLSKTQEPFPQFEPQVNSNNIWAVTDNAIYCYDSSGSLDGQYSFPLSGPSEPVRSITFDGASGPAFLVYRKDGSGTDQGAIARVPNNCQMPDATTVVTGLTDVPSTALIAASDGFMYYGTENGKLMRFDSNLNASTEVASFANAEVVGFLTEDANGDIVGVAKSMNGGADKMFAYNLASDTSQSQDVPEDRPIDLIYPGFTEIN